MAFWKLKHGLEGRVTHGRLVPMFMIIGRLLLIVSSIIFQWLPAKSEVNIVMSLAESWRFGLGSILVIDPSLLCVMIWVVSINLTRFVLVPSLLMQSKIVSWQLKSPTIMEVDPNLVLTSCRSSYKFIFSLLDNMGMGKATTAPCPFSLPCLSMLNPGSL